MRTRVRLGRPKTAASGIGPSPTCRAPAVAMQFGLVGSVNACCQNGLYNYGDVRREPVGEIWNGEARLAMAAALADGVYPPGCEGCGVEHAVGNRKNTPAQAFDRFPDGAQEWPRQMEFTLSNRCNLQCIQCNGLNSSAIRAQREHLPPIESPYRDEFFEELGPYLEHLEVAAFLGGEPFLSREARRVWDMLIERGLRPEVEVTTNATIWNERVERYAHALRMSFAVSIDGATAETYESIRIGAEYARVVEVRDQLLAATRGYGARFHLNYCLMPANWFEVGQFLMQADGLGVVANVIPVFAPDEHSLFKLGAPELSVVVEALEGEDATMRRQLGINRPIWDRTVSMLRSHLDRIGSDSSSERLHDAVRSDQSDRMGVFYRPDAPGVFVPFPGMVCSFDDRRARRALADLTSWAEAPPVEVVAVDGQVVSVGRAPGTASAVEAEHLRWVGASLAAIRDGSHPAMGRRGGAEVDEVEPGLTLTEFEGRSSERPCLFQTLHVDGSDRVHVGWLSAVPAESPVTVDAVAALHEWAGRAPLEIWVPRGVIATMEQVDAWSDVVSTSSWVGLPVDDLPAAIAGGDPITTTLSTRLLAPGLVQSDVTVGEGRDAVRFRMLRVPASERVYLAAARLVTSDDLRTQNALAALRSWGSCEPTMAHADADDDLFDGGWIDELGPGLIVTGEVLVTSTGRRSSRVLHVEGERCRYVVADVPDLGLEDPRTISALERLGEWSQRQPIEMRGEAGMVVDVGSPEPWAVSLGTSTWLGAELEAIRDGSHRSFRRVGSRRSDDLGPGLRLTQYAIESADGYLRVRTLHVEGAQRLFLVASAPAIDRDDPLARAAVADLETWAGVAPLEVHADDSIVVSVVVPPWAASLDTDAWTGLGLTSIQALLVERLGVPEHVQSTELAPGLVASSSTLTTATGPMRFRSLYIESADLLLLVTPDPIDAFTDS